MPKKKTPPPAPPVEAHIIEQPVPVALELNYMPYTMSVIVSRAIPEIDGFKPAHRKLLYTMYKMGLLTGGRIKSADVVGQTMRLNPHGDGPIYETLVRLTRGNNALLHPFVDSKGNFGKQYSRDMAYAASRYTEVKLDAICQEIFKDIDKNTVDMVDNYNSTTHEPVLLPTTFPNLLVTPNHGIAVGMASTVCSFNLKEVCLTTAKWIMNPETNIMESLPAPDFSSGGQLIYKAAEIENIYNTGRGSVKLRAKYRYDKKNSCIEVYEIPYTTTMEAIIDKVVALVKAGKIRDITDIRDETDLNGLKIAIDIKKSADPDMIMHRLFSMTTLQDSFSCNFNILVNGRPRTMGIEEILTEWLAFRMDCLRRQIAYDIDKKTNQAHLLEGLSAVIVDIDKAIKIIRETESEDMVIPNLMAGFKIDKPQAEFVAEIRLRNLNREYLLKRVGELDNLLKEIAELTALRGSDQKIHELIAEQLKAIAKKYGEPRRTEIIQEEAQPAFEETSFIEDYSLKLFLTEHGYLKKISLVSLRSSGEQNVKEDDRMMQIIDATNKMEILFFSDRQAVYRIKAYDLPDAKASSLGDYLANRLEMEDGERILYMVATTDYAGHMIFGYENGKVAKVPFIGYDVRRKRLLNAYSDKSRLVGICHFVADGDIYMTRGSDKAMVLSTEMLSPIASRSTGGVQVFTLRKNTTLTMLRPLSEDDSAEDMDYYRVDKFPSAGHFVRNQMRL
ncbi:MAG: DNA topoisomerase (ATP-hydrolyzing) subunit A [Defluviitaleaceae bacterium]|nr:DNA topoisomerase (ATP-hydrolyzing) subunit A [Defluviitaleaceae bacterium]